MKYLFISIVSCLFFWSCSNTQQTKYTIGVSQCSDDLWRETMNKEMLREASISQDVEVIIKKVKDDTEQQIKDIQSFIDQDVDLLVISPNESAVITPIVQKAFLKGIPVILIDRRIDTEDYTAYVGADNFQIGKETGLYIAQMLNGKGNVVEMRGRKGSTSDLERHLGFIDGLKNYPEVHIVAERYGNYLKDVAEEQMGEILKKESDIDLVFAMNDPMAVGVHNSSIRYSGNRPFIVGIDALPGKDGGIENIEKGLQDASLIYPTGGDVVINLALSILEGKPFDRENTLYTAVVDKKNARVLQLQTNQIVSHQTKLERMNELLDHNLERYSNQQTLFYLAIGVLLLLSILLVTAILGYTGKSKANKQLERSNREIKEQAEILTEQKTQLLSLSKQLEEATHAKLVFFTNISHEFRTPLTLILGPIETLLDSEKIDGDQKELLNLMNRNGNKLLNLISQIIEFRSYENDKMTTHFVNDDMVSFLKDLNTSFSDYARRKQINFVFDSDSDCISMCFDKEKVEKIYFNLLSNAFKHTTPNGLIRISLRKDWMNDEACIQLSVFNDGKAIPEDKINNIFDRFYKVDMQNDGTGIGLALTSALVDIHRGKIWVESSENIGTKFTVLLPINQSDVIENILGFYSQGYTDNQLSLEEQNTSEVSVTALENTNKPIVLLIEDNYDMRSYMRIILENEYVLLEADNGDAGVKQAIKHIPDIVVSDILMPEKDGIDVCKELKENLFTCHIPIILLTACSLDEQRAIGFESGADAYITKPFNAEILKIRIRKLIETRKALKQAFGNNFINDSKHSELANQDQQIMADFQQYVENNISNPELNINDICKELGLSRIQFYRKFKSLTDYTPNELIRIIRLKIAYKMLLSTGKTVSEVAYETGFSSPSYFSKCFKELYKESPIGLIDNDKGDIKDKK